MGIASFRFQTALHLFLDLKSRRLDAALYSSLQAKANASSFSSLSPYHQQMAKGCTNNDYEEARKQRLEENKKRFEDLGISTISKNLSEIASSVKKSPYRSPKTKSKRDVVVEPRRSSRVRNPVRTYREDVDIELPTFRKRSRSSSSWGSYIARPLDEIKEATDEQRARALEAAEKLQSNLQSENPSFIKSMVRSHVYSCFWLGLPLRFCAKHLPKTVCNMILEDETGKEFEAVFIGNRSGLSGGWRGFALEHKLDDGDALVFELTEKTRFKIYRIKAFPDSAEEYEKQILKEEGNKRAKKAPKANSNSESEFNKTKNPKKAIADKINEVESSKDNLPESNIDTEVKPQEVKLSYRTRFTRKKVQDKSKGGTQVENGESKEAMKPKSQGNKTKKSKESVDHKIDNSDNTQQVLSKNNPVGPKGASLSNEDGIVQDGGPVEEKSKSVSKPRKMRAPKLFRKRV
ncbi:B3 domain-containing protein Os05g0481400-like isoform X2 [Arachis stenosperma]|uniref:B3 domain-containing protein Os05g0481400-like isoform X2 n=1 Tax=Arachis stenosperma TaxID=217475 RepID=UPI0025AD0B80|nr:B3 domain-containing protein Os05g0481400-like isoform X2 [Arachis stenosperma]